MKLAYFFFKKKKKLFYMYIFLIQSKLLIFKNYYNFQIVT